jgi:hypothetical protein
VPTFNQQKQTRAIYSKGNIVLTRFGISVLSAWASALALVLLFISSNSQASTTFVYQTVNGSAVLDGANGIYDAWSKKNYDVSFQDGSCNSLFSGCAPSAFSFIASAGIAHDLNNALLGAIFATGSTLPQGAFKVRGCEQGGYCTTLTPINDSNSTSTSVNTYQFFLSSQQPYPIGDYLTDKSFNTANDTIGQPYSYAIWSLSVDQTSPISSVPEPASYAMALAAIGLISFATRRQQ